MKATHSGHCQACGSLQKLPKGKLSLHGYSVTHGFFNGICRGARELPFELSCGLVERFITEARARLADVEAYVKMLRTPATTPFAYVSNYEGDSYGRNRYITRRVEVIETRHELPPSKLDATEGRFYSTFHYVANGTNGKKDVTHKLDGAYNETLLDLCSRKNNYYADKIEACDIKNLVRYISWQTQRVASWAPAALLPVETKNDKQQFELSGDDVAGDLS